MLNRNLSLNTMPKLVTSNLGINYIDSNNKYISNEWFIDGKDFNSNGIAIVQRKNGYFNVINKFGILQYDIGFDHIVRIQDFPHLDKLPELYFVYIQDIDMWNILETDGSLKSKKWFKFHKSMYEDDFEPDLDFISFSPTVQDEDGLFNIITTTADFISSEWFINLETISLSLIKLKKSNGLFKLVNLFRIVSPFEFKKVIKTENSLLFIVQRAKDDKWNVIKSNCSFLFNDWFDDEIIEISSYELKLKKSDGSYQSLNISHEVFSA